MIERAKSIEQAIDDLASINPCLFPIKIPEQIVKPEKLPNGDISKFPYHYDLQTYIFIAEEIKKLLEKSK